MIIRIKFTDLNQWEHKAVIDALNELLHNGKTREYYGFVYSVAKSQHHDFNKECIRIENIYNFWIANAINNHKVAIDDIECFE